MFSLTPLQHSDIKRPSTHLKNQWGSSSVCLPEGHICHWWRAPKNGSGDPARPGGEHICIKSGMKSECCPDRGEIPLPQEEVKSLFHKKEFPVPRGQVGYMYGLSNELLGYHESPESILYRICPLLQLAQMCRSDLWSHVAIIFLSKLLDDGFQMATSQSSQAQHSHHLWTRTWNIQKCPNWGHFWAHPKTKRVKPK